MGISLDEWIVEKLGVTPCNIVHYREALTPRQYEVLEFLGDSVLDFLVADSLVHSFPGKSPGWYTQKRMNLVNAKNLAQIAREIGLPVVDNSPENKITDRVLGDMLEALIGAIYLDQGIEPCQKVLRHLLKLNELKDELARDFIMKLQEFLDKRGFSRPVYQVLEEKKKGDSFIFLVEGSCQIGEKKIKKTGRGRTKQEAIREAAHGLFEQLQRPEAISLLNEEIPSSFNYVGTLQEFLAQKKRPGPEYSFAEQTQPNELFYRATASCSSQTGTWEGVGIHKSKKMAKQLAAKDLLKKLKSKKS